MNGHHPAVQFDHRVTPGQVALSAYLVGMLDPPGDDLPAVIMSRNFPFGTVGPRFFLLQQLFGRCYLFLELAFRILRVLHPRRRTSASAKQSDQDERCQVSNHPSPIDRIKAELKENRTGCGEWPVVGFCAERFGCGSKQRPEGRGKQGPTEAPRRAG
jgi:hypothetical protein